MNLFDKQIKEGLMISKLSIFARKEQKAKQDIKKMFFLHPQTYVSCSWGKQSIILTHMTYQIEKDVIVVFFNEENSELITNFNEIKNLFISRWKINYQEILNKEVDLLKCGLQFMNDNNLNGILMGLSSCESKARKITLTLGDKNNIYQYRNKLFRCCPLASWTVMDCVSYIAKYNLPVLSTYKKFGFYSRTSAGITLGSHAEIGFDCLSSSSQEKFREIWRNKNEF